MVVLRANGSYRVRETAETTHTGSFAASEKFIKIYGRLKLNTWVYSGKVIYFE